VRRALYVLLVHGPVEALRRAAGVVLARLVAVIR
jgi:hypothetical protein